MKIIRISRLAPAGLTLSALILGGGAAQQPSPWPPPTKIAGHLYQVRGGEGANTGFYVRNKDVVLIDIKMTPQGVRNELDDIKKVTSLPVTTLILTHSDNDHILGLRHLEPGLRVIAHENVQRDLERLGVNEPAIKDKLPIETYRESLTLEGGGRTILLRHYGPAHTDGDTVVYFPAEKAAFIGDLAFVGRDPLIHLSKNGTSSGYAKTLRAVLAHEPPVSVFCAGHADPLDRAAIEAVAKSVEEKRAQIEALVKEGKTLDDVKAALGIRPQPDRPGGTAFPGFVEVVYRELAEIKK
jgi:glyoxylase-like metal-dependent hydrolase (beta-lactamase superfamily II)